MAQERRRRTYQPTIRRAAENEHGDRLYSIHGLSLEDLMLIRDALSTEHAEIHNGIRERTAERAAKGGEPFEPSEALLQRQARIRELNKPIKEACF